MNSSKLPELTGGAIPVSTSLGLIETVLQQLRNFHLFLSISWQTIVKTGVYMDAVLQVLVSLIASLRVVPLSRVISIVFLLFVATGIYCKLL